MKVTNVSDVSRLLVHSVVFTLTPVTIENRAINNPIFSRENGYSYGG